MLLETLDVRNNDILIYSENKFDFENNFKIIFKNEEVRIPKKLSYFQVCEFVKDASPKNLIAYRLLTNVRELDSYSSKYGFFVYINDNLELIYFDPIFAINDLKHLRFDIDPEDFRFKIQQIGLTSLASKRNEAGFTEIYHFDLHAEEAQNQNDKIYADAIFALDENYISDIEDEVISIEDPFAKLIKKKKKLEAVKVSNIAEVKAKENVEIRKIEIEEKKGITAREDSIELLKKALGIKKEVNNDSVEGYSSFQNFIANHKKKASINDSSLDMFKKATNKLPKSQRDEEVILRFKS